MERMVGETPVWRAGTALCGGGVESDATIDY